MKASRRSLALLASSCAALISGCMVGPDHKSPDVALNASWSNTGDPRLAPDAAAGPMRPI